MSAVTIAGWAAILYCLAKLLTYLSKYVRTPLDVKKLGDWALVTGATDGIGKGFCMELARRGLNIVLISRTPSKLQDVAAEIEEKYKVKTKIVDIDFTKDQNIQERIESETKDLTIGVLVNNVGMSYDYPEYFLQIEDGAAKCKAMVDCNINSMLNVTRAVLPAMVARGKGAVINMSSFSAFSGPLLSVYAASKAFVIQWSADMELEYSDKGITIMCACPYYVVSNMSKIRKANWSTPTPVVYSKSLLGQLGCVSFTTGFWAHDLMHFAISVIGPLAPIVTLKMLKSVRVRALKKKERLNLEKKRED
eukprot:TRINITY_DN74763_c0_g1_i1.p1 TRINITY_DN74763_c0_g1~~TRINITY_DN74763_c0_g1_i1.p1  ORF type:complete len:307 (-),score=112.39 TRINITY_DN74763_c0_g1_i1:193-1113(-)